MARAKADGHRVVLVVATRGELGEQPPRHRRAGRIAGRTTRHRNARGRRAPRRRPGRVPRVRRFRHGRRTDEQRTGIVRRAWTSRPRRSDWHASCEKRTRRRSPRTTTTADTVIPTTSRSIGSAYRAAEIAGTPHVFEATTNRDHFLRLIRERPPETAGVDESSNADGRGPRRHRRRRSPDHHHPRRARVRRR